MQVTLWVVVRNVKRQRGPGAHEPTEACTSRLFKSRAFCPSWPAGRGSLSLVRRPGEHERATVVRLGLERIRSLPQLT